MSVKLFALLVILGEFPIFDAFQSYTKADIIRSSGSLAVIQTADVPSSVVEGA